MWDSNTLQGRLGKEGGSPTGHSGSGKLCVLSVFIYQRVNLEKLQFRIERGVLVFPLAVVFHPLGFLVVRL